MDSQRTFLAITLCVLVILGWNFLTPLMYPAPPEQVNATMQAGNGTAQAPEATQGQKTGAPDALMAEGEEAPVPAQLPAALPDSGRVVNVETPLMAVAINPEGGVVKELQLLKYNEKLGDTGKVKIIDSSAVSYSCLGIYINGQAAWGESGWTSGAPEKTTLAGTESATLTFSGNYRGLHITRELTFKADSYLITEKLRLENPGGAALAAKVSYAMGVPSLSAVGNSYNVVKLAHLSSQGKFSTLSDLEDLEEVGVRAPETSWGTVQNNYFLAAIMPVSQDVLFLGKAEKYTVMPPQKDSKGKDIQSEVYRIRLEEAAVTLAPGGSHEYEVNYYMGPKEYDYLHAAPEGLTKTMDYGWFGFISEPMIWFVNFLYSLVGNYGVAIIIMTVVIKLLLWPLSQKSYKSMERMRKIQPFIKQVQEKYKDDKPEMQREIMRLYKAYKVNPAAGCLPILVQLPVFIGLYQGLLNAVELRHASFITHLPFTDKFWLADLSAADPYYITPLIMGASMFVQQKMTPPPGDPMQAKMMMFMPLVFIFFFLNFPSGLVVYWLVNNLLSIAQQWYTRRSTEKAQAKAESGKADKA